MKPQKYKQLFTTKEAIFLTILSVPPLVITGSITNYKPLPTFLSGFIGYMIGVFIIKLWRKRKKRNETNINPKTEIRRNN